MGLPLCGWMSGALALCVYVSEGRSAAAVAALLGAARQERAVSLVHCLVDAAYNRTGLTVAAETAEAEALARTGVAVCAAALEQIDLRAHHASHPRLGAVDHVSCHALAGAPAAAAAKLARSVAAQLGGPTHQVPTYLYGDASPAGATLADVRRDLGFFDGETSGRWAGSAAGGGLARQPDHGPGAADDRQGVACVGATPWVVNYNVLLRSRGREPEQDALRAARAVARATSARGGGLPLVQAMALPHADGIEVACNLLDAGVTPPADVLARVRELAELQGLLVAADYCTNKRPEEIAGMVARGESIRDEDAVFL